VKADQCKEKILFILYLKRSFDRIVIDELNQVSKHEVNEIGKWVCIKIKYHQNLILQKYLLDKYHTARSLPFLISEFLIAHNRSEWSFAFLNHK
jgi:hypothetical protein